jgi:hypothetical protein
MKRQLGTLIEQNARSHAGKWSPVALIVIGAIAIGLTPVAALAGTNPSIPIAGNGATTAYGDNPDGQLWAGAPPSSAVPVAPAPANFAGSVVLDTYNGSTKTVHNPCKPTTMARAKMISAGGGFGMALIAGGYVCVWGDNYWGEEAQGGSAGATGGGLNPTNTYGAVPACLPESWTLVTGPHTGYGYCSDSGALIKGATSISAGGSYALVLFGNGSTAPKDTTVTPVIPASSLPKGAVAAWGANYNGELGSNWSANSPTAPYTCANGNSNCAVAPVAVAGGACGNTTNPYLDNVTRISAGYNFALAKIGSGTAGTSATACSWGDNTYGELGLGGTSNKTAPVGDSPNNCPYVGASGSNYCSWAPQPVQSVCGSTASGPGPLSNVYDLSGGFGISLALLTDGQVCAWGDNTHGEIGINNNTGPNTCTDNNPPPGSSISCALVAQEVLTGSCPSGTGTYLGGGYQISAGYFDALALISSVPWSGGTVCSWGDGAGGGLGNGSVVDRYVPGLVWGVNGFGVLGSANCISAGVQHSLAVIGTTGTLVNWGDNFGVGVVVGYNNGASTLWPVNVLKYGALVTKVSSISAGLGKWNLYTGGTSGAKGCLFPPPAP